MIRIGVAMLAGLALSGDVCTAQTPPAPPAPFSRPASKTPAQAAQRIGLRIDGQTTEATVLEVSPSGVLVEVAPPAGATARRVLVSWDRLSADAAAALTAGLGGVDQSGSPTALAGSLSDLWRARTRIERGDWPGAEPIIEQAMLSIEALPGAGSAEPGAATQLGPTQATIARSAMVCRLHREAHVGALRAYFLWLRSAAEAPAGWSDAAFGIHAATGGGRDASKRPEWFGGTLARSGVIDDRWGLCPELPPIFLSDPAVMAFARDDHALPGTAPAGDYADELIRLYRQAMRFESGLEATPATGAATPASIVGRDDGSRGPESLRLVRDIVNARMSDGPARTTARAALLARIDREDTPPWVEAWCRAAVGRSFTAESDPAIVRAGVLQLLHVPARFGSQTPHLAAICLAESAVAMERIGEARAAEVLRRELGRRFPGHPALNWTAQQTMLINEAAAVAGGRR